jgi:ribosomal protein S16
MLLQAGTPPSSPFFSNDMAGFVRVLLVFGAVIGSMTALVVKLFGSKFRDDIRDLTKGFDDINKAVLARATVTEVNAVGGKVDTMAKEHAETRETTRKLGIDVERLATQQGDMRESMGRMQATLDTLRSQNVELQRDMTAAITESGARITKEISELATQVARLDERDRLADALARLAASRERETGK